MAGDTEEAAGIVRAPVPLRVLMVTAVFPPFASSGSTRVGKTARYLTAMGHDVRVLTTHDLALPRTAPAEIDPARVVATRALNLHRPSEAAQGGRAAYVARGGRRSGPLWDALHWLWRAWTTVAYVPDYLALWYPFALAGAACLTRGWRPDVVLSSGPPHTAHLVARALARRHRVPWVAELRDLWIDNPTYAFPPWRRRLDGWLERRVLGAADALVTVAEPFAATLRARYRQRVEVCANGFDPDDLPPTVGAAVGGQGLRLVHTGTLYRGRHAHDLLLAAIARLDPADRAMVKAVFVGRQSDDALAVARDLGVADRVEVVAPVPYREALALQARADVLVLLGFKGERTSTHAKLYEYAAARRPVLVVAGADNDAARFVAELGIGRSADDPAELAAILAAWLSDKRRAGALPATAPGIAARFTRQAQIARLADLLAQVAARR